MMTSEKASAELEFLIPAVQQEAALTRKVILAVPADKGHFRSDEKAMSALESRAACVVGVKTPRRFDPAWIRLRRFGGGAARRQDTQQHRDKKQRRNIAHEMTVLHRRVKRLIRHDSGVDNARPDGEPDQAAVSQRVSRSQQEKNSESRIYAENHLFILGLVRLPTPSRGPEIHHQRVNAEKENQAHEN
jgi:hypothetical protein